MSSGDERSNGFKINLRRGMKRSGKKSKKWQIIRDQNICISRNNDYKTFQQDLALTKDTIYRKKRDTEADVLSSDDDETLLQKPSILRRRDLDYGSSTSDDDDDDDETSRQKLDDSNVNISSPGERNDEYMDDIRKKVERVAKEERKWLKNSNDSFSSITSSDDDAETSEHDLASSHKVSSLGDENVKYTGDVRKEVEKWAKDSGYWQEESDTDDSSTDDSITDAKSVRGETNEESTDDNQELEEYAEDLEDFQRDSSDESSNVSDVTAVGSKLGVFTRSTDDAPVVSQDELGEDSEDDDERNEPEISADGSNGGFPSDCEVVSPNLSVHSVETDSTVISQDEMSEDDDDDVQKETETSVDESQQCKKKSDGGCASGDNGEEFKLKFSASNKLADMFSQNLQNEQDLRKRIKLYLNDDDGLSEDETNFLDEKLAELKEQLESFRKKKKAKSSSNLDEKKASRVQPMEFKQKLDENPRNEKKYDDRDEVCSPMDWLNTTSTYLSHLNFSSTRLAESDVKIETIKSEKKMEDSQNEKDDSYGGDFPKPIRIKVEDSQNEKDERYVSDFPKPIPIIKLEADDRYVSHCPKPIPIKLEADDRYVSDWPKLIPIKLEAIKDKEDDSYNEKRYDRYDYNREIEVNRQSGLDSGKSSRMSAEVEQKRSYTRKEDFGNERNYHYNYDQQKEVKQSMVHGSSSSSLLDRSSISTDGGRSYRVGRKLDATTKSSGNGKRNLCHPSIMYYHNRGYHHNKMKRHTGHGYFYSSPNRRTTTESNRKNDFIRKERDEMTSHNSYYKGRRQKERRKWARDSNTGTESDSSTSYSEDERSFRYTSQPARFEEGFDAREIINMKTDAGSEEEFDARDIINMNKIEEGFDARDIINMNKAEPGFEEEFDARDIINMRTINRVTDREDSQQDDYETASEQWPSEDDLSNLDESPKFVEGVQVGLKINLNVEETRRKVHKLQDMREDMWKDDNRRANEQWPGGDGPNIEPFYTYSHEQQPEPESNLDALKKETNVANSLHVEAEAGDWEPKNRLKKVRFQDEKMDTDKDCVQKTNSRGDDDGIWSSERRPTVKRLGSRRKAFSATVPRKYAKWRSQSACHEPKAYRQRRRVFKLQKRSKPKREPICTNCWHPNHVVQNCMGSKRCDSCKKDGHATDLCWFRPGKRGRKTSSSSENVRDDLAGERDGETSKKCGVYKKTGHATNRCWFRGKRDRKPSSETVQDDLPGERDGEKSKKCSICKKTGHATDRCWFRPGKRGRKTSSSSENVEDDLLDESGCETTLQNVEDDLPGEGDCETTSENSEGDAVYWYG